MADQRYLVTARKYRPALFKELVAQEHVTDTLKNAIRLDRLAHAYLFSGPRGVGKTTAARILAKAINCTTPLDEREDQAEPCRRCDSCRSFEAGRSLNIFEIDAASNNKVDDIRELRETVRIPPQGSKKKVYIIDEVHMLSKQAFNALLKTLEEPPPHALFIFATTEPHKVLPTILSRCQRFDFRRIPVPEIVERLREICAAEDITADEESLMLLARKGDGALRDALSAFDQAISLCGDTIEYAELAQALGVVDIDLFFKLTDFVATQDTAGVLRLVDDVVRSGYDLHEFLTGLAEHLRNLLVAQTLDDEGLIDVAKSTRQRYNTASQAFSENDLLRLLLIAGNTEDDLKSSTQPRLKLEMALLKMTTLTRATDLRTALQQIDRLEQMARDGDLPASMPATDGDAQPTPDAESGAPASSATREPTATYEPETPPRTDAPSPPSADSPSADSPSADADSQTLAQPSESTSGGETPDEEGLDGEKADTKKTSVEETDRAEGADPTVEDAAPAAAEAKPEPEDDGVSDAPPSNPTPPEPAPSRSDASDDEPGSATGYNDLFGQPALKKKTSSDENGGHDAPTNQVAASSGDGTSSAAVATVQDPTADASSTDLSALWSALIQAVAREERIRLSSYLQHASPNELRDGVAHVAVPDAFHQRELREHHTFLQEQLADLVDQPVERLRFVIQSAPNEAGGRETPAETDPYERMRQFRRQYPVVNMLFDDFGGELIW